MRSLWELMLCIDSELLSQLWEMILSRLKFYLTLKVHIFSINGFSLFQVLSERKTMKCCMHLQMSLEKSGRFIWALFCILVFWGFLYLSHYSTLLSSSQLILLPPLEQLAAMEETVVRDRVIFYPIIWDWSLFLRLFNPWISSQIIWPIWKFKIITFLW